MTDDEQPTHGGGDLPWDARLILRLSGRSIPGDARRPRSRGAKILWIFALALILVAAARIAAVATTHPRSARRPPIINGTAALHDVAASLVHVYDDRGPTVGECTGTVITPRLVLTAGHCLENPLTGIAYSPTGFRIFDSYRRKTKAGLATARRRVSRVIVYPGFRFASTRPDAGLLVLSTPTSQHSEPLNPPQSPIRLDPGARALLVGWSSHLGDESTPYRVQAQTVIVPGSSCEARPAAEAFHPRFQLCAIDAPTFKTGVCKGDSGGPLLVRTATDGFVEVGIAVLGPPNCTTHKATSFTRVSALSEWVGLWTHAFGN